MADIDTRGTLEEPQETKPPSMTREEAFQKIGEAHTAVREQRQRLDKIEEKSADYKEVLERATREMKETQTELAKINRSMRTPSLPEAGDSFYVPREYRLNRQTVREWALTRFRAKPGTVLERWHSANDTLISMRRALRATKIDDDIALGSPLAIECRALEEHLCDRFVEPAVAADAIKQLPRSHALHRAMDTQTSGEGSQWVQGQILSASLIDMIRDLSDTLGLIVNFQMPNHIFAFPQVLGRQSIYRVGESTTASATKWPETNTQTGNTEFRAESIAARILWSIQSITDMTVEVGSVLMRLQAVDFAERLREIQFQGDADGTHQDSDTHAAGSTDHRWSWDGFRKLSLANSHTSDGNGPLDVAAVKAALKAMGPYGGTTKRDGGGAVIFTSWPAYFDLVSEASSPVVTVNTYGPAATIVTGELANIFGRSVVPTEFIRTDVNAAGIHDGQTETKTTAQIALRNAFALGAMGAMDQRVSDIPYMETGQIVGVSFWRGDMQPLRPVATEEIVHTIYNLST